MASFLPDELVQEILVRLPPNEHVNLVHASLVCKAWRHVICDRRCFLHRCREFHGGGAPPLLGDIRNRYYNSSPITFVSAPSTASRIRMPAVDSCSGWSTLDCRHGRVLILDTKAELSKRLIVWHPVTGRQQHLSVPPYYQYSTSSTYCRAGAVLCAEHNNGCDHLDCHDGPFMVVIVQADRDVANTNIFTWASMYSSSTGDWSTPTLNNINHNCRYHIYQEARRHSVLIGDALYFAFENGKSVIIKYDLHAHWLSEIDMPQDVYEGTLMMNQDRVLELATVMNNCIHLWSRQDVTNNGIGGWVQRRVLELETLVPKRIKYEPYKVIGSVEGTNTIFINVFAGVFMLDIKTKKVKKFGKKEANSSAPILPYESFYAPIR